MEQTSQLIRIIEGALFAADQPLSIEHLLALFTKEDMPEKKALRDALSQLQEDYQGRGVELKELGSGFQFQACPDLSQWISRLWDERAPRFSRALMETLALVAYRQPITRGEIEEIRGVVVSTNIMRTLVDREWVRIVGFREVPGRPALYATTKEFLNYFGLKRLQDLPPLAEIADLDLAAEKLEQIQVSEEQLSIEGTDDANDDDSQNESFVEAEETANMKAEEASNSDNQNQESDEQLNEERTTEA